MIFINIQLYSGKYSDIGLTEFTKHAKRKLVEKLIQTLYLYFFYHSFITSLNSGNVVGHQYFFIAKNKKLQIIIIMVIGN